MLRTKLMRNVFCKFSEERLWSSLDTIWKYSVILRLIKRCLLYGNFGFERWAYSSIRRCECCGNFRYESAHFEIFPDGVCVGKQSGLTGTQTWLFISLITNSCTTIKSNFKSSEENSPYKGHQVRQIVFTYFRQLVCPFAFVRILMMKLIESQTSYFISSYAFYCFKSISLFPHRERHLTIKKTNSNLT